jgi:hypothetical protein
MRKWREEVQRNRERLVQEFTREREEKNKIEEERVRKLLEEVRIERERNLVLE